MLVLHWTDFVYYKRMRLTACSSAKVMYVLLALFRKLGNKRIRVV